MFLNISYKFIISSIIVGLFFFIFPQADIYISSLFVKNGSFYLQNNPLIKFIYDYGPIPTVVLAIIVSVELLIMFIKRTNNFLGFTKKGCLYTLICIVMISGLIVNSGLKGFSGRARPRNITEFGGNQKFTKVFVISNQCETNCSFVSGHASAGFIYCALALLFKGRKRKFLFYFGLFAGWTLGLVRIVGGGHFFSDVYFSFVTVYFFGLLIHYWMYKEEYAK